MYEVSLVPTNEITKVWDRIEPLVDKVIPYTYGRMLTVDVLHSLIINHYHLWIIYKDDEEIEAIAITEFMKYPRKTVLLINFISFSEATSNSLIPFAIICLIIFSLGFVFTA